MSVVRIKRFSKNTFVVVAILILLPTLLFAQSALSTLVGYGWSSTIGWVEMSGTATDLSAYGVEILDDDTIEGYAWTEHLGWVQFGNLTGCPAGTCDARLDQTTGEIEGWARVCSATTAGTVDTDYSITKTGEFDLASYMTAGSLRSLNVTEDGTRLYVVHSNGLASRVIQFSLSTAFDVTTASYVTEYDDLNTTSPYGVTFNADGSVMFISQILSPTTIESHSLTTNYDVSTASYVASQDIDSTLDTAFEMEFNPTYDRMYISAGANVTDGRFIMAEYSISGDDVTTLSLVQTADAPFRTPNIGWRHDGFEFNNDGTRLIMEASTVGELAEYTLSTPYDFTTAVYEDAVELSGAEPGFGIAMNGDGTRLITLDHHSGDRKIVQYDLEEPWDLTGTKTEYLAGDCTGAQHPEAGGWDGWISLNCSNDSACATSDYKWEIDGTGAISGYAWGGDVVGWVYANDIASGLPTATATIGVRTAGSANPLSTTTEYFLTAGEEIEVEWDSNNAYECLSTNGGNFSTGAAVSGVDDTVTEPIANATETFSVLCYGVAGDGLATVDVTYVVNDIAIWAEPIVTEQSNTVLVNWDVTGHDPTACTITGPDGFVINLGASDTTGSQTTDPILGETTLTISCAANGVNPATSEEVSVRINATGFDS